MKNLFVLVLLVFFINAPTMAATMEIPVEVLEAFEAKFPDAGVVSWSKKGDLYFSTFDLDDQKADATFKDSGEWVESNFFISEDDLPEAITDYLSSQYEMAEVLSTRLHETPQQMSYHLSVSVIDATEEEVETEGEEVNEALGDPRTLQLIFDEEGNII